MPEEPTPGVGAWPVHRRIAFGLCASLIAAAAIFYLWWGFSFGVWLDNGIYAVVITLAGFGLAGMWLVMPDPPAPAATVPRT